MSLPMGFSWALCFAQSCTSHKLACMSCLKKTHELHDRADAGFLRAREETVHDGSTWTTSGVFSGTVTEVEKLLELVSNTFNKRALKLHE